MPGGSVGHAAALLLKSIILLDYKRYGECDQCVNSILAANARDLDAYELSLRLLSVQVRFVNVRDVASRIEGARKLFSLQKQMENVRASGELVKRNLGSENPRAKLLYAQSIYHLGSSKDECERALLECVESATWLTDAAILLGKFYDKHRQYSAGVTILKKFREVRRLVAYTNFTADCATCFSVESASARSGGAKRAANKSCKM